MTINDPETSTIEELGKALQDARLKAKLAVEEVAVQLNLGISTVRDIEDDLDNMIAEKKIPAIYLRGYIANYAKLVTLAEFEQFAQYQQLLATKTRPGLSSPPLRSRPAKKRGKKILLFILLLVIFGAAFFVFQHFFQGDNNLFNSSSEPVAAENKRFSGKTVQPLVLEHNSDAPQQE